MIEITSEALNSIRLRCEARMPFQSSEVLSLIAEVERLRAELDIHMGIAASAIYHGAKRSAESQWQPMETAPRDGTMVLMWTECGVVIGFWGQRANQWLRPASSHNKDLEDVRHWMPLPKPPEKKS